MDDAEYQKSQQRTLPAAAVPFGAVVRIPKENNIEVCIGAIDNSSPRPGRITWYDYDHVLIIEVGAADLVEIVSIPKETRTWETKSKSTPG